jgi:ATP-dependent helicase/DNAse subunit B
MKINYISVSRLQTYQTCPQQYKYKYHLELAPLGEEPLYFAYGSIIHKIAEEYIVNKGEMPINEIANDVLSGKIDLGKDKKVPKLTTEYKNKMPEHLRAIKKISDQIGYEGFTEYEFLVDLDPPNQKMAKGFIDRLIQKDDKFWILDYKTTKKGMWRKNAKTISNDLQLRTYARIVQREFGAEAHNIKTGLYYLEGAELLGACFTEQSLENVEIELIKYHDEISNADPNNVFGNVGPHCSRCDYKKVCPFYSVT